MYEEKNLTAAGARQYAEDAQPTRRPQVNEEFATLADTIARCEDNAAQLEKSLVNSGVLRMEPQAETNAAKVPRQDLVPAAERLRDQSDRARRLASFIDSLTSRLEI